MALSEGTSPLLRYPVAAYYGLGVEGHWQVTSHWLTLSLPGWVAVPVCRNADGPGAAAAPAALAPAPSTVAPWPRWQWFRWLRLPAASEVAAAALMRLPGWQAVSRKPRPGSCGDAAPACHRGTAQAARQGCGRLAAVTHRQLGPYKWPHI